MDKKNDAMNDVLDWDSEIESDGKSIELDGDYNFQVVGMERGRVPGSQKLPACNKATLSLLVYAGPTESTTVRTDLILHKSLEWKLSQFFRCIGQKKHGERIAMNWDKVEGSCGRAHFKPRKYTDKNGNERTANDVDYFIDYDEKFFDLSMWKDADASDSGF